MMHKITDLALIWKRVDQVFPYMERMQGRWDDLFQCYLPKVLEAASDAEYFLTLSEFINHLDDGHTDIRIPRSLYDQTGYFPYKIENYGGVYYADGRKLLGINNMDTDTLIAELSRYVYHTGSYIRAGEMRRFLPLLLKKEGNILMTEGGSRMFSMASQDPFPYIKRQSLQMKSYGDILWICVNDFMTPGLEEQIRPMLPGKRGVILDLRENTGGMTSYGIRIAELFFSGKFCGCRKKIRLTNGSSLASASQFAELSEKELEYYIATGLCRREDAIQAKSVWDGQCYESYQSDYGTDALKAAFDGPMIVLTSRRTISAAEDIAAVFRINKRALLVGEPTYGSTGTPLFQNLHAGKARICSIGYEMPDGTPFIGHGLQPDVPVWTSMGDILQGREPVLETALTILS